MSKLLNDEDLKRNLWKWATIDELQDDDPLFKTIQDVKDKYLIDSKGKLVPKTKVKDWINSYEKLTPYQALNDNASNLWLHKRLLHSLNKEFERLVDNFFTGLWATPSQIIGAFDLHGDNKDVPFLQRLFLGIGNTGIASKEFALKHPYLTTAANMAFDLAAPIAVKGSSYIFNPEALYNIKTYMKHPTYKTYYHGSEYPFPIKDFYRGTKYDIGLHVGDYKIAKSMAGDGVVYKIRAPRPNAETIDIGHNNYRHLSKSYRIQARPAPDDPNLEGLEFYDSYPGDRLRLEKLRKKGVNLTFQDNKRLYTDKDVDLNLRELFPNVEKNFGKEADAIINEGNSKTYKGFNLMKEEETQPINIKANNLLSKAGYKVVKYVNANPYERYDAGVFTNKPYYSYFITDPEVILVMQPWPKVNFNTALKLGATNAGLNTINNKE